jgi:hypothetical protein
MGQTGTRTSIQTTGDVLNESIPTSLGSAALERVLPRRTRDEFLAWLVRYHLDELNGCGDRLRYVPEEPEPDAHHERALEQCRATLDAIDFMANEALPAIRSWVADHLDDPTDAFAPAAAFAYVGAPVHWLIHVLDDPATGRAVSEAVAMVSKLRLRAAP